MLAFMLVEPALSLTGIPHDWSVWLGSAASTAGLWAGWRLFRAALRAEGRLAQGIEP